MLILKEIHQRAIALAVIMKIVGVNYVLLCVQNVQLQIIVQNA